MHNAMGSTGIWFQLRMYVVMMRLFLRSTNAQLSLLVTPTLQRRRAGTCIVAEIDLRTLIHVENVGVKNNVNRNRKSFPVAFTDYGHRKLNLKLPAVIRAN